VYIYIYIYIYIHTYIHTHIYVFFRKSLKVKSQRSHPVLPLRLKRMEKLIIQLVKAKDRQRKIHHLMRPSPQMSKHRL